MISLKDVFSDVPPNIKKFGVVGWPVSHSLSPAMQQAALDRLHVKSVYRAISVKPAEWKDFLRQAKEFPLDGFNVTVPFKEMVKHAPDVEVMDPLSLYSGASNTVKRTDKGWAAFNTDGEGLRGDLVAEKMDPKGRPVVLLGAGGAARGILWDFFCGAVGPKSVVIVNRTGAKAEALRDEYVGQRDTEEKKHFPVTVARSDADVRLALAEPEALLINATSLGLKAGDPLPIDPKWLVPGIDVYDLIYHRETELMAAARKAGARKVCGGLGMLVRQGALAFEIWFGQKPPLDVMRRAAEAEMERRKKLL